MCRQATLKIASKTCGDNEVKQGKMCPYPFFF